eukprot:TRINITY_DN20471_c0_g1_i1.p1 TRINITY_DN20471_c0_g1~~TRINITY_DN20471_c0_g1_i1.p1  ORF type:complete len:230 (+),score=82.83 TRINITY_DN20471_c0_g1_i1:65-754(+)
MRVAAAPYLSIETLSVSSPVEDSITAPLDFFIRVIVLDTPEGSQAVEAGVCLGWRFLWLPAPGDDGVMSGGVELEDCEIGPLKAGVNESTIRVPALTVSQLGQSPQEGVLRLLGTSEIAAEATCVLGGEEADLFKAVWLQTVGAADSVASPATLRLSTLRRRIAAAAPSGLLDKAGGPAKLIGEAAAAAAKRSRSRSPRGANRSRSPAGRRRSRSPAGGGGTEATESPG